MKKSSEKGQEVLIFRIVRTLVILYPLPYFQITRLNHVHTIALHIGIVIVLHVILLRVENGLFTTLLENAFNGRKLAKNQNIQNPFLEIVDIHTVITFYKTNLGEF